MTPPIPTVDELAKKLDMQSANVRAFKQGTVVTEERDASNDKDLCLLVAAMVDAPLEKTWQFVLDEKVAACQDANLKQGHINLETFELEGFKFEEGTEANLSKYNMSAKEAKDFSHAKDKQAAFLQMLSNRAKSFWEKGLKGIEPYEGKNHDVANDLDTANKALLKVIDNPQVREEVSAVPSKSKNPAVHSLVWSIVKGNSMTSIVLSHAIRYKEGDKAFVVITRKFYSGADFDASMITAGVIPTSDGKSAMFYVNHTFSPAVAGFGGGAKRSVGRKMMKGALVETMQKAQKALT
jgi:hypothetical protein